MTAFNPSTRFGDWILNLKLARGIKRRAQWAAWAQILGDTTIDWATQANLEHLPSYASAQSVALIASERQMDTYPGEATAQLAAREPYAVQIAKFDGTPLGVLLGLHFSGFDGAILVTQNGRAFQLTLPLPAFLPGVAWDPTGNVVITNLGTNPNIAGTPSWWTFDANDKFCSRFAVLWYGAVPPTFLTHARATFTGAEDGGATPWPTITWNNAFPTSNYTIRTGPPILTATPTVVPAVGFDTTTQTATGVQMTASGPFVGYVDVLAYQNGADPYADPHPTDLARLRAVIAKRKPAKALCTSISVCTQGRFVGWPVRNTVGGAAGVASTVVSFAP